LRVLPPRRFPSVFIDTDLADQNQTCALSKDLAPREDVFGIVNTVGVARHETIDAVDFEGFITVMDLNVRPALQLTQALLPNMRSARREPRRTPAVKPSWNTPHKKALCCRIVWTS
jgi:short-subunit dehydrogenase